MGSKNITTHGQNTTSQSLQGAVIARAGEATEVGVAGVGDIPAFEVVEGVRVVRVPLTDPVLTSSDMPALAEDTSALPVGDAVEVRVVAAARVPLVNVDAVDVDIPTDEEKVTTVARVLFVHVETAVWALCEMLVVDADAVGSVPRTEVERIVEVAVSVNVVDGSTTVIRVVWVATGRMQLITPDWLNSMESASSDPPVIVALVQVVDCWLIQRLR